MSLTLLSAAATEPPERPAQLHLLIIRCKIERVTKKKGVPTSRPSEIPGYPSFQPSYTCALAGETYLRRAENFVSCSSSNRVIIVRLLPLPLRYHLSSTGIPPVSDNVAAHSAYIEVSWCSTSSEQQLSKHRLSEGPLTQKRPNLIDVCLNPPNTQSTSYEHSWI
jgi:hypothetical protein